MNVDCYIFLPTFSGAYTPLTMEGNILIDGILASCYAYSNQDIAHIGTTPLRWFPEIAQLLFGKEDELHGFTTFVDHIAKLMFPSGQ